MFAEANPLSNAMRLVGGTATSGRLQVLYGGAWQQVTSYQDGYFDHLAAAIVCRALGYIGGLASYSVGQVPESGSNCSRVTDRFSQRCSVQSTVLQECNLYFAGSQSCQYPVTVSCSSSRGEPFALACLFGFTAYFCRQHAWLPLSASRCEDAHSLSAA